MPSHRYSLIAKEGWPLIVILLFFCVVFNHSVPILIYPTVLILIFVVYLLRDPHRLIPSAPLGVVSPVHGTITLIEQYESQRLSQTVWRIRIRMNWMDIYSLRSPIEGKIIEQWATRKEEKNKRHDFLVCTDEGDQVLTKIEYRNKYFSNIALVSGQRIGQGKRCGFLFLGGEVDVSIAGDVNLEVTEGVRVQSGSSVIAHLVHHDSVSTINMKHE